MSRARSRGAGVADSGHWLTILFSAFVRLGSSVAPASDKEQARAIPTLHHLGKTATLTTATYSRSSAGPRLLDPALAGKVWRLVRGKHGTDAVEDPLRVRNPHDILRTW